MTIYESWPTVGMIRRSKGEQLRLVSREETFTVPKPAISSSAQEATGIISGSLIRHASNPPSLHITTSLNLKPGTKFHRSPSQTQQPQKNHLPQSHSNQTKPPQPTSPPPPPPTLPLLRHLLRHHPKALRLDQNPLHNHPTLSSLDHILKRRVRMVHQPFIESLCLDGIVWLPELELQDADDLVHGDLAEVAEEDEPAEGLGVLGHDAIGYFWMDGDVDGCRWMEMSMDGDVEGWMDGWMDGWRCGWRC